MITNLTNLPPNFAPNYVLCISWIDAATNNLYRYALWLDVGEVFFFNTPLYAGQLIKKNFRFEIWSTNIASVYQNTTINFYTSVLNSMDYRWGTDSILINNDPINLSFNNVNGITTPLALPLLFPIGCISTSN